MYAYKRIVINGTVVLEHRYIMEQFIGRKLRSNEVVHHKDGNKQNNSIENLELLSNTQHSKMHSKTAETIELSCDYCHKKYFTRKSRYEIKKKYGQKVFTCSKQCTGKLNLKYLNVIKGESKYKDIIEDGIKKGYTGYKISKIYKLNRRTVYNYLKNKRLCSSVGRTLDC